MRVVKFLLTDHEVLEWGRCSVESVTFRILYLCGEVVDDRVCQLIHAIAVGHGRGNSWNCNVDDSRFHAPHLIH